MTTLDSEITSAERDQLRNMVTQMRDHFEQYHSRRENIAWGAVTIYLAGIAAMPTVFSSGNITLSFPTHIALALGLLLTCFFVLHFVRDQFRGRHVAAAFVGACGEVIALLSDLTRPVTYSQIQLANAIVEDNDYACPELVRQIIEDHKERNKQRRSKRPRWNELALLGVMVIWTSAVVLASYCLPDFCRDNLLVLACGLLALPPLIYFILRCTEYKKVIDYEWKVTHYK